MVDKKRVAKPKNVAEKPLTPFATNRGFRHLDRITFIQHPKLGMVTMRFEAFANVDPPRSVEKWEADFHSFVNERIDDLEKAARYK